MSNENLIKKIFDKTILTVLSNISDNYHDEVIRTYNNYLIKHYEKYNSSNSNIINAFVELEISKWKDIDESAKLSLLLDDKAMDKIREIASLGFDYAKKRFEYERNNFNNESIISIDVKKANENIDELNNLIKEVREFNSVVASKIVTDAIMDFQYACGENVVASANIAHLR